MSAASAFDAVAQSYDASFTDSFLGSVLRRAVWRRLDDFLPGDKVLDLGCGTGADALYLAGRGVRVLAIDASEAMVEAARLKVARHALETRIDVRLLPMERLGEIVSEGPFDGVLSNFGALNCVADLGGVAKDLAMCTRQGGRAFLCMMGPVVPWEWVFYLIRAEPGKAFRRLRPDGSAWRGVRVRYPSIRAARSAFSPEFTFRGVAAVGALVPPSYAEAWAMRHQALIRRLDRWERRLEVVPPLPWLADHYLLDLVRA